MRRRWFSGRWSERIGKLTHSRLAHDVFWIGILFKAIDGVLETAGGVVLLIVSQQSIVNLVYRIFHEELTEDPTDWLANFVLREVLDLSPGMKLFAVIYLLTHGLIKLVLAGAIWRSRLWAYPLAGVVFSLFVIYQAYRFAYTYSIIMLLLTVVDLVIIALLFPEYNRVKAEIDLRNRHAG
jgi:uncharacterized membrane protein